MDFRKTGCEDVKWTELSWNIWWAFFVMVMNVWVSVDYSDNGNC